MSEVSLTASYIVLHVEVWHEIDLGIATTMIFLHADTEIRDDDDEISTHPNEVYGIRGKERLVYVST